MTAETSQSCTATCSSSYGSSYYAYKAFDKSNSTCWASSKNATGPWLQLQMPQALYNITITITNRSSGTIAAPLTGEIWGSNDGTNYTQIGTYSRTDATAASASTTHACNNQVAYSYIKVCVGTWNNSDSYAAIGELGISGADIPTAGGWKKVVPYMYEFGSWAEVTPTIYRK